MVGVSLFVRRVSHAIVCLDLGERDLTEYVVGFLKTVHALDDWCVVDSGWNEPALETLRFSEASLVGFFIEDLTTTDGFVFRRHLELHNMNCE